MPIGMFRNLVLARAIAVEPIARALCADPIDAGRSPTLPVGDGARSALIFNSPSPDGALTSNHEETAT